MRVRFPPLAPQYKEIKMEAIIDPLKKFTSFSNSHLIDACGVIVSSDWVEHFKKTSVEKGQLQVTEFSQSIGLRRSALLCLLRRLFKGSYLPSSDTYFILADILEKP